MCVYLLSAKDLGEFEFHSCKTNQSYSLPWLEFNKDIDITVRAKIFPEY